LLQVEVPLVTSLSQPLIKKGLIKSTVSRKDKRVKPLALTDEGVVFLGGVDEQLSANLKQLESGLDDSSLQQYFQVLSQLITNVEKYYPLP
jgi:DNA-binding MarR family transcriptional regulator